MFLAPQKLPSATHIFFCLQKDVMRIWNTTGRSRGDVSSTVTAYAHQTSSIVSRSSIGTEPLSWGHERYTCHRRHWHSTTHVFCSAPSTAMRIGNVFDVSKGDVASAGVARTHETSFLAIKQVIKTLKLFWFYQGCSFHCAHCLGSIYLFSFAQKNKCAFVSILVRWEMLLPEQARPTHTRRLLFEGKELLGRQLCIGATRDFLCSVHTAWAQHNCSSAHRKTNAHLYHFWCVERWHFQHRNGLHAQDVFVF